MKVDFKPSDFTCKSEQFIDGFDNFNKGTDLSELNSDTKKIVSGIKFLVKKYSIDIEGTGSLQELLNKADLIDNFEVKGIVTRVNCIIRNSEYNFSTINNYIEYLEKLINTTSLVLRVDLEGNVKWANELFCSVSGYSLDELNGKSTKDLSGNFNEEKPVEFWKDLWDAIQLGKTWRGTIKNQRKNGEYFWSDTYIIPKNNQLGEIEEYYVIRTDVTETEDLKDKYLLQALNLEKVNSELENKNNLLSELALTDGLTGLYNRRSFDNRLNEVLSYSSRAGTTFGLVLLDIDFFKKINDTYGHDGGDIVLTRLSNMLKIQLRSDDFTARVGGEEFSIIVCDTTKDELINQIERLRKQIEKLEIKYSGNNIKLTSSFGITVSEKGDTPTTIYKRVDDALYEAKNNGRNRVEGKYIEK